MPRSSVARPVAFTSQTAIRACSERKESLTPGAKVESKLLGIEVEGEPMRSERSRGESKGDLSRESDNQRVPRGHKTGRVLWERRLVCDKSSASARAWKTLDQAT